MRIKEQTVYKEGNFEITSTTIDDVYNVDEYETLDELCRRLGVKRTKKYGEQLKLIGSKLLGTEEFEYWWVYQTQNLPDDPDHVIKEYLNTHDLDCRFAVYQTSTTYNIVVFASGVSQNELY